MVKTKFEKLVRDRIPEIIRNSGKTCQTSHLAGDALKAALKKKLVEEANEVEEASQEELIYELADVLEVVDALIKLNEIDRDLLAKFQAEKRKARGGFESGLFLHWVEDET